MSYTRGHGQTCAIVLHKLARNLGLSIEIVQQVNHTVGPRAGLKRFGTVHFSDVPVFDITDRELRRAGSELRCG